MSDDVIGGVVKVIEVVGSSPDSFSDAVRTAVKAASRSIRNITGVEVLSSTAEVDRKGDLTNYKVNCKIAFLVETSGDLGSAGADAELATGVVAPQGGQGAAKKATAKKSAAKKR